MEEVCLISSSAWDLYSLFFYRKMMTKALHLFICAQVQDMFDVEYYIGAYKVSIAGAIFHLNEVPISLAYAISHVIIFMLFNHKGCREAYCWNEKNSLNCNFSH